MGPGPTRLPPWRLRICLILVRFLPTPALFRNPAHRGPHSVERICATIIDNSPPPLGSTPPLVLGMGSPWEVGQSLRPERQTTGGHLLLPIAPWHAMSELSPLNPRGRGGSCFVFWPYSPNPNLFALYATMHSHVALLTCQLTAGGDNWLTSPGSYHTSARSLLTDKVLRPSGLSLVSLRLGEHGATRRQHR